MKKTLLLLTFLTLSSLSATAQHLVNTDSVSDYKKIIVAVEGGYSMRLEKISSDYTGIQRDHMKNLNRGFTYKASAYYMFNYRAGVGLEYNAYRSSENLSGSYPVQAPNGDTGLSKISDDVTVSFYGVGFIFNLMEESRQKLYFNASFGYLHYKNDIYYMGDYKITAGGLGTSVGLTYQYLVIKDLSIGPKISFSGSSIRKFTTKGGGGFEDSFKYADDDSVHFTRLDLGLQLMYRF